MDLSQSIDIKDIKCSLQGQDKESVIAELVDLLFQNGRISSRDDIFNAVMERELIRSTGVGKGFAIPHCKTALINEVCVAFGICQRPIEFSSIDGEPVKLIALLVSPSAKTGVHIQALAGISRIITSPGIREKLFSELNPENGKPWDPESVYNLIAVNI